MDRITIDKIKGAASIVDVVSDYTQLRKKGVNFEGLCPFHEDASLGSFYVSPSKNICKCFSCDKGGDPVSVVMEMEKFSYLDALRYLAQRYSIPVDDDYDRTKFQNIKHSKPRQLSDVIVNRDMLVLQRDVVRMTVGPEHTEHDMFCTWLRHLPWDTQEERDRLEQVLWMYCVGHWNDGRVVFWQIDEKGQPRSGKLMRYLPDGHRDKSRPPGWIHNQQGVRDNIDLEKNEYRSTLFGMHLIKKYPRAVIHLVESEKTALICATHYGDIENNLWLACGGLKFLKIESLAPLFEQHRSVYLWPDKDGVEDWIRTRNSIKDFYPHAEQFEVNTEFLKKEWKEADGPKADIADIILRTMREAPTDIIKWNTDAPFELQEELNDPELMRRRRILSRVCGKSWHPWPLDYNRAKPIDDINKILELINEDDDNN